MATKTKTKAKAKTVAAKVKAKVKTKTKTLPKTKGKTKPKAKAVQVTVAKAASKVKTTKNSKIKNVVKNKKNTTKKMIIKKIPKIKPYEPLKNEVYMNEQQLQHFEMILKNWKEQLLQQADNTKHNMQDGSAMYADIADRAYQEEEFSRELRTRDRERKLAKKIDEALDRIKDKSYGFCEECGAEIGAKRLEARPTATQCVECKTVSELKEKQVGELEE